MCRGLVSIDVKKKSNTNTFVVLCVGCYCYIMGIELNIINMYKSTSFVTCTII